jgi:uncharacterized protein (TIGR03086 family)
VAPHTNNPALLEPAIGYVLGSVSSVTPRLLSRPTPCVAWDLGQLVEHVNESLAALHEGIATGRVGLGPGAETAREPAAGLVTTLRHRAERLLGVSGGVSGRGWVIGIADRSLDGDIMKALGAVEMAVHGWDIARGCGCHRPIPPALATAILDIVPLVVTEATRHVHFAAPVPVAEQASPSDQLAAALGRDPDPYRAN